MEFIATADALSAATLGKVLISIPRHNKPRPWKWRGVNTLTGGYKFSNGNTSAITGPDRHRY